MGTRKNRHNEKVLLSTTIYDSTDGLENFHNFAPKYLMLFNEAVLLSTGSFEHPKQMLKNDG